MKKHVNRTFFPRQFYLCKVRSYIFIKHFFILPIFYHGSKLINLGFLILIRGFIVIDSTGLHFCSLLFVYKILEQSKKFLNGETPL